jgi:hypothetical protein
VPRCKILGFTRILNYFTKDKSVSRVHRTVDWRSDCDPWFMVDHSHGRRLKLTGVRSHWCSRARDLTVVTRGARKGDGDPYPGWHEVAEGLGRPSVGEGRQWWSELDEKVLEVRR